MHRPLLKSPLPSRFDGVVIGENNLYGDSRTSFRIGQQLLQKAQPLSSAMVKWIWKTVHVNAMVKWIWNTVHVNAISLHDVFEGFYAKKMLYLLYSCFPFVFLFCS